MKAGSFAYVVLFLSVSAGCASESEEVSEQGSGVSTPSESAAPAPQPCNAWEDRRHLWMMVRHEDRSCVAQRIDTYNGTAQTLATYRTCPSDSACPGVIAKLARERRD
jgi:hypothetical protein